MEVKDVTELLSFVLNTTYFQYKGTIYQQKLGAAMGGPCSLVVANIGMDYFFRKCQDTAPEGARPKVALEFVDDFFKVVDKSHLQTLTDHMNQLDDTGNLKFTSVEEENGKLPFLDTLISRNEDGSLSTKAYCKPTHLC